MFKLKDRIFHHSEKFKALIESQEDVELMETDDYGWENYRYESSLFRLAHVERYSHMGLEVVHITCFPRENSKSPVFGFDVVGYQNDEKQMSKIEKGFTFLATVGSTTPFIGLFGTVWGIMNSFQSIAISRNTSLAIVAPGIAEALFATALGLLAAIPAVVAYNKFNTDSQKYSQKLENFSKRFLTII